MKLKQYTVISTFAGCGGSSLGYEWAGFKELLAIEWDENAVKTLKSNFKFPIWEKDIREIKVNEILKFCNIKKGSLDILDGSPPCQGFSISGKRQVNDSRNDLFKEFIRLIEGLQPKIFVMENVSGMIKGKMKGKFIEIMRTLKSLNYQVKCKLMNAMYYNVPQSRERLIFIGVRNDLNIEPSYPKPSKKIITVREVFKNIDNSKEEIRKPRKNSAMEKALLKTKQGELISKHELRNYYFNSARLAYNKPARTLTKSSDGRNFSLLAHPIKNRSITILEAKRLCSFPDNFILTGNFQKQWACLGNAVMPKFMQAIAKNIKDNILDRYYFILKKTKNKKIY